MSRLTAAKPLGTRVWGLGKLLMLAGALVATFFLSAGLAMRAALRAREVQVPDLAGRSADDASKTLWELGLTLRVDENRRLSDRVPEGRIAQQEPAAGVAARSQRSVRVWLSNGASVATVPALIGQTERTARIRIAQDALALAAVSEFRSPDYPPDAVVAQSPPPATRDSKVSVLVNRGEQAISYVMPDLIGTDGTRAAEALRTRGFRAAIVGEQPYSGVPPGTVVRQNPAGGFQVGPSDAISLEVSR